MLDVSIVLVLLYLVTILSIATRRWTIPYPTIMVLTGLGIALTPGLPAVQLTPEVVFLTFLPPLLYGAAWNTPWRSFVENIRPISFLAFGLVLITTVMVGLVTKWIVPDIPWAAAFALGAIVSPPDAVAATSLTRSMPIPRRIVVILEGESLLNDATGLVAYRMAVAAVTTGAFSLSESMFVFVVASIGGLVIGLIGGWLAVRLHRHLDDPLSETTLTLLTPYADHLPCEAIHVSGVLAVVACGLYVSQRSDWLFSSATRLHAGAVWGSVLFVLNGLTFIFIGLGLREVMHDLKEDPIWWNLGVGVAVLLTVIGVRIAWVFPAAYMPRRLIRAAANSRNVPPWQHIWLISWTGMRGVVSLAAALALPLDFPYRSLILFVVFIVILGTLVLQSLSLPWMIRRMGVGRDGRSRVEQEIDARLAILAAANMYLDSHGNGSEVGRRDLQYLRAHFETQAARIVERLELQLEDIDFESEVRSHSPKCQSLYLRTLSAQRSRLKELEHAELIDDEVHAKLRHEIDLEETRLKSSATLHA
ncbi:MAG: Na+/H+ antiporter [Pirellulales bacterium]